MNLFNAAKSAFGYSYPNFGMPSLCQAVSKAVGCQLVQTRFYTGMPSMRRNYGWWQFWRNRIEAMRSEGVYAYTRELSYAGNVPQEKGIDMRIALDAVMCVIKGDIDTLILFSMDQDFTELLSSVREIAQDQGRFVRLISAFPVADGRKTRGIDGFDWFRISRDMYDACIDPRDYRPRKRN